MVLIKKTTLKSPAKINLHLRVLKKVPNKYHLIESLVSLIGLYDEITIKETLAKKTKITFLGKFSKTISFNYHYYKELSIRILSERKFLVLFLNILK